MSHEAVIREEARRTRATMWKVALVVIACVILSPFLFVAAPVLAVIVGVLCLAGLGGAVVGKWFARRREMRLLGEIWQRDDKVVPIRRDNAASEADVLR
jgi:hypothetical protein